MPYEDASADKIIRDIRKRKGLKLELPVLEDFIDKLWTDIYIHIYFLLIFLESNKK